VGFVVLSFWLATPGRVVAGEADPAMDAAIRAAGEAWYTQYILPGLQSALVEGEVRSVPLDRPSAPPAAPAPHAPRPRALGSLGPLGVLVLDPDVPRARRSWGDEVQPAMFRLYFEPARRHAI
jgi:hypothetical protein